MNADTAVVDDPDVPRSEPIAVSPLDLGDTAGVDGVDAPLPVGEVAGPADEADTVVVNGSDAAPPAFPVPRTRSDGDTVTVDGVSDLAGSGWTTLPLEDSIGSDDYLVIVTPNGLAKARPNSSAVGSGSAVVSAGYMAGEDVVAHRALMFDTSGLVVHAQPGGGRYVFAGISITAANAGALVDVTVGGVIDDATWGWVKGSPVFVTSNGILTQIEPTSGIRHQIGTALSDKSIFVSPQPPSKAGATVLTVESGAVTQRPLANLIGIEGAVDGSVAPYTELYGGNF